jgi:catechol 2,3-dioxygenase-like lactoylglutathione lyase family enzyme
MKLPFFRSRKRKDKDEAPAAEQVAAAPEPPAAPPEPAKSEKPATRNRRVPAEQVVDAFGYALAAVPSLGPTVKAWRKLGFHVSDTYAWQGCQAAHIDLEGGGIRFVAADSHAEATTAADLVRSRLILGAGLFGWTWSCREPHRSALAIGQLAGSDFHADCEDWGDSIVQIPMELTPAAATWLEKPDESAAAKPSHANSLTRLDHIVLQVSASKAAAQTYEKHFGLRGKTAAMNDRYYAFLKAGPSLLEIVGPMKPGAAEAGAPKPAGAGARIIDRITGGPWGLAFGSTNIDATVTFLKMAGIEVNEPHRAVQGGRITGMPAPLGGIQLAFMGE